MSLKLKITKMYLNENKSISNISEELDVSEEYVKKILKHLIAPKRSSMEEDAFIIFKKIFPLYKIVEQEYLPELGQYVDIYIKDIRLAIELDGIQHSKEVDFFHGTGASKYYNYDKGKIYDKRKEEHLIKNSVYLLRINYTDKINLENIRRIIDEHMESIINNIEKYNAAIRL